MLLKNLKKLINEADTTEVVPTQNTDIQKQKNTVSQNKPKKDVENVKSASDGIKHESYQFSNDMTVALIKTLKQYYNVYDINVENNLIIIKNDLRKTSDPSVITSKLSGKPVNNDSIINTIQMIVTAAADTDIDNFTLEGPISDSNGLFTISAKYTPKVTNI